MAHYGLCPHMETPHGKINWRKAIFNPWHWGFFLLILVPWCILVYSIFTKKDVVYTCITYDLVSTQEQDDDGGTVEVFRRVCTEFKEKR